MSYWTDRQKQFRKSVEKSEAKIKKRLSKIYDEEARRIEKEIADYFQRYGEDNVIEYRKMMELLDDEDRRLLMEHMDAFAEKYPEYAHLMPVRESIYKLNRLQGLQASVSIMQGETAGKVNSLLKDHFEDVAVKGIQMAEDILGRNNSFLAINPDILKKFVDVPWSSGESFSEKIWGDAQKLADYLNTDIAQGLARGENYDTLTKQLMERFGKVSRNDAYRLLYTEGTYVMAESSITPFEEDFEQYKLSTVGDGKVCPICRDVAEQTFNIEDREPGVNFPPLHPWCRCTFEIVVDDWDAWMDDYVAKHGDAENSKIIANLSNDAESDTIKLRINYFDKDDPLYIESFSIEEEPGFEDVCGHGNSEAFEIIVNGEKKQLSAQEFADYMIEKGDFHGQDLRLVSCAVGQGENSFAQQLSKILGIRVKAPDNDTYYDIAEGTVFIGAPYRNVGMWRIFDNGVEVT